MRSIFTLLLIAVLVLPLFPTPVSAAYENTYKKTGNMRNDIIGVALTQVGYKEGSRNYTKYGVWYGQPNSPWCGMFVSWCAKEAGIPTSVLKRTGIANPKNFGLSYKSGSSYTPKKGDLFFKKNFGHVGLVYYTDGAYFYTVEGNTSTSGYDGHSVMIRRRKISDYYFSSPNYSGSSSTSNSCAHKYETKYASAHPHKEYKQCKLCDKKTYTGKTKTSSSCKTCIQANCDHDYSAWKKTSSSKHSKTCTKCSKTVTASHNWKDGKILKKATCVTEGKKQLICTDCKAESTKVIKATGKHTYGNFIYLDDATHQKTCTTCDKQVTSKHTVSKSWKNDTLYHWTSCSDCGGRIQHNEHTFSEGCLNPCDTCGYTHENGHTLPDLYTYDQDGHWKVCTKCETIAEHAEHTYTSDCDEICNDCGYIRTASAQHQDSYHADDTGHWQRCSSCTRVTEVVPHVADENTAEWETQHCSVCDYALRENNHTHTFHSVEYDNDAHWGSCICGEVLQPEVHSWDFQTGACSICNIKQSDIQEQPSGNLLSTIFHNLIQQFG